MTEVSEVYAAEQTRLHLEQLETQVKINQDAARFYASAFADRMQWAREYGLAYGANRDYYASLGYNKSPEFVTFYYRYQHEGLAARVIRAFPDETWRLPPKVFEDDTEVDTAFEAKWKETDRRVDVVPLLHRADILQSMGRYSAVVLGFNDISSMEMLSRDVQASEALELRNLSVYSERHVVIKQIDVNIWSERFGQPLLYEIDFDRTGEDHHQRTSGLGNKIGRWLVHWSRVVHVAEDLLEDNIFSKPLLQDLNNYLDDTLKVVGGSAESFWRNARRDLIIQSTQGARITDPEKYKEKLEEYIHDMRQFLILDGMELGNPNINVVSPKDNFDVLIQLISGAKGIPKRILIGTEAGELASTQDEINWSKRNMMRIVKFANPLLRRLIDRLILYGALPTPKAGAEGYTTEWEPLWSEDETTWANRVGTLTNAISTYAGGQAEVVMPREEFRETYLRLDPKSPYLTDAEWDALESEDDDALEEEETLEEEEPQVEEEEEAA